MRYNYNKFFEALDARNITVYFLITYCSVSKNLISRMRKGLPISQDSIEYLKGILDWTEGEFYERVYEDEKIAENKISKRKLEVEEAKMNH